MYMDEKKKKGDDIAGKVLTAADIVRNDEVGEAGADEDWPEQEKSPVISRFGIA